MTTKYYLAGFTVLLVIAGYFWGTFSSNTEYKATVSAEPSIPKQSISKKIFHASKKASADKSQWLGQTNEALRSAPIDFNETKILEQPLKVGEELSFTFFDDVETKASVLESFKNVNGTITTLLAAKDDVYGRVVMAQTNGEVRIKAILPSQHKIFEVQYNHSDGKHYALEFHASYDNHECGVTPEFIEKQMDFFGPQEIESNLNPPVVAEDESSALTVIDVMVVYPDNVVTAGGTEANILNIIAQGIALTNDSHNSTETGMYINLIHSERLSGYTDSGSNNTELTRVTNTSDGYIDNVHTVRDEYGADFVCMMTTQGGGLGWRPNFSSSSSGSPNYAFNTVGWSSFASYTPAHELGHNMNLSHSKFQSSNAGDPELPTGTDAAGWYWHINGDQSQTGYCSIMSYTSYPHANCTRVGLFSNPNITNNGQPAGDVEHGNCARVLSAYKSIFAAYRERTLSSDTIQIQTPNGSETLSIGEDYAIRWNSNGVTGNVKIELYRNGSLDRVISESTLNDRVFNWTVPDITSGSSFQIRISSVNETGIADFSDNNFIINQKFYNEPLNSDPSYTTGGEWEFGTPTAGNTTYGGAGSAKTGTNIYDTDLSGTYNGSGHTLVSTAVDCSDYYQCRLSFEGIISVTNGDYGKVEISTDLSSWTELYSGTDLWATDWTTYEYDISSYADYQPTVYIRWTVENNTAYIRSGFSLDDIAISGIQNAAPTVSAGDDATVTLAGTEAQGSTSDDNTSNDDLTITWSKVSGPGDVTFGDSSSPTTSLVFSEGGTYVLRLTVSDGVRQSTDEVTYTVTSDSIEDFVNRFYTHVLNRSSDASGLSDWATQLRNQTQGGADIARGFVNSTEFQNRNLNDSDFLDTLYIAFFNRAADSGGKTNWQNAIDSGTSREQVVEGFINSLEFSNLADSYGIVAKHPVEEFVTRFYQQCLNREPDLAGLSDWVTQLKAQTRGGADIAVGFIFSAEFTDRNLSDEDYLTVLYRAFFNREPDTGGYNSWLNQLTDGTSRLSVLNGFLDAQEFANLCTDYGIVARLSSAEEAESATEGEVLTFASKEADNSFVYRSGVAAYNILKTYNSPHTYFLTEVTLRDSSILKVVIEQSSGEPYFIESNTLRVFYEGLDDHWQQTIIDDLNSMGFDVIDIKMLSYNNSAF